MTPNTKIYDIPFFFGMEWYICFGLFVCFMHFDAIKIKIPANWTASLLNYLNNNKIYIFFNK